VDTTYRGVKLRYETVTKLFGAGLAERFVRLDADESTRAWIDHAIANPCSGVALTAQKIAKSVMSDYDANALAGTYDMRVVGTAQLRHLLPRARYPRVLDVGAGDGMVTKELAPLADEVVCTELSAQMAKRLRKRGYRCEQVDLAIEELPHQDAFDLVALLNVIDRTSLPITLLARLGALMAEDARLLLAVPFPLRPHVHAGPITVAPEELLPRDDGSWEAQATTLCELVFRPCGYEVEAISRVPYLCRGPARRPVSSLDDALFVLRRRSPPRG